MKIAMKDILIYPSPDVCQECQAPTYFAVFQPWKPKNLCPKHLVPLMRKGSYEKLLSRLWDAVYYSVGNKLFEPQRAYWETLSDEQKWLQVGNDVDLQARKAAQEAVQMMRTVESEGAS